MVQTAAGGSQWRIHELRAFDGGAELPRAQWKATAHPFPWGMENALDGNPVTFWESGDVLSRGADVQVEFGGARTLDSVLLETSPSQPELRLQLYGETARGEWARLDAEPEIFNGSAPDLRRAAAQELKRRGIGYVLLFENDEIAKAVREGGEAAGFQEIGQSDGARLYRLQ
jgi:hypothetical protein